MRCMVTQKYQRSRDELLTCKDVQELTKIKSRSTVWRKSRDESDNFPRPYKDGTHFTRWKLSEIEAWIDELETV